MSAFTITKNFIRRWAMPIPWRSNKNGLPARSARQQNHPVKGDDERGKFMELMVQDDIKY
jgi:hypothetical protein